MVDYITGSIRNPSFLSLFLAYFGGVLSSFSPCIYPVIPVVVGVIGAANVEKRVRALTLSLSYAVGIALVYTALGVIAALTGHLFGEIATSPYSYLVFGNVCLLLAFWMMDWIQLPYLSAGPDTKRKGHIGVFVTGLLSGLVVAPCASPVLFGLLLYVSTTRNVLLGGSMLFSFSIGMSTLLIVIGTFSGVLKLLPRPGEWMVWVKRALALGLFILAQYYLLKAGGSLL